MLRKRILVTGVGGGVGQGVIKALKRIPDLPLTIVGADMSPKAAGLYACDEALLVPAAKKPGYIEAMVALCQQHAIDVYIPGTDIELEICAAATQTFQNAGIALLVSPPSVVAIADDKYETAKSLERLGFPFPQSWLPGEIDPDALAYPIIVKPRRGYRSIGVDLVQNAEELRANLAARDDDPVIQECVASKRDEYTCTVAVIDGEASPVLPLRRTLRNGDTYQAEPVYHPAIERVVRGFALALGIHGSCNFQLRLDGDEPKIFEINARFSGTTPFCAQLGFNPVEFCLKRLWGLAYVPNIRWDAIFFRHWAEMVVPQSEVARLAAHNHIQPMGHFTTDLGEP